MRELLTEVLSRQLKQSLLGALLGEAPQRRMRLPGKAAMQANMRSRSGLSVENAEPYTAAAHGQGMVGSGWYGAASADWIMEQNTATTHQHWMRDRYKKQF